MSDMQLSGDEANEFGRPPSQGGGWADKLIAWGIVKNRQQAEYAMIGIAVVILIIAFFVYRSSG